MSEIEHRKVVGYADGGNAVHDASDKAFAESAVSAAGDKIRQMLTGLERELLGWIRQLSDAETNYAAAHASIGELLDAAQLSILVAQARLRFSDTGGQEAVAKMMFHADRLHRASRHFQRQACDLAGVGGILRLIVQTVAAVREREPAELESATTTLPGVMSAPTGMTVRLSQLRIEAEQLALASKSVTVSQVLEFINCLQCVMEALIKPAAKDFAELEIGLVEIRKQNSIVKKHLIGE